MVKRVVSAALKGVNNKRPYGVAAYIDTSNKDEVFVNWSY